MYQVRSSRHLWSAAAVLCLVALGGCDVAKFTADSTAGLFTRAAPAFESYWDYDILGYSIGDLLTDTIELVTDVQNGSLQLNRDGSLDYTPAADFNGTDNFTYRVSDGSQSDTGQVTINISAINDADITVKVSTDVGIGMYI